MDEHGNPTIKCAHCGGRVKTAANGKTICGDCNQWQDAAPRAEEGEDIHRDSRSAPEALGTCPKCEKGRLHLRRGSKGPFVACSDRDGCRLSYDADADGQPLGGWCAKCKGPIRVFQSGAKRCASCGEWVNDGKKPHVAKGLVRKGAGRSGAGKASGSQPPKPKDAACPTCGKVMKTLFTRRGKWTYRCEGDNLWVDA